MVRGDVHSVKLPPRRGRAQRGRRYAVIVQNDDLLALSTLIVCPTSTSAPAASFHPEIELGEERTRVMCEMAGVVDAGRLGEHVGHLSIDELEAVDEALELVLGLA